MVFLRDCSEPLDDRNGKKWCSEWSQLYPTVLQEKQNYTHNESKSNIFWAMFQAVDLIFLMHHTMMRKYLILTHELEEIAAEVFFLW